MMRVLDLFSGIGGFSLGLERTGGFRTVTFCEIEPFCRRVLAKHWPEVPCYDDVRTLTAERLRADGIAVDVICGGFPCQDISSAGAGAGLAGERSGLWREYARLVGELRPRYVLVENVAALLGRGLGTVLGDLAALGFDAEWHCIPAAAVGAPHRRDRVWIVSYSAENGNTQSKQDLSFNNQRLLSRWAEVSADAFGRSSSVAYAPGLLSDVRQYLGGCGEGRAGQVPEPRDGGDPTPRRRSDWWRSEPNVGRVADGVPARVDRLRSLGNAVVPQIPELLGRAILEAERARM